MKQTTLPSYPMEAQKIIAKKAPDFSPEIAIILGSGLGKVANQIKDPISIPYEDLPCFNVSKIAGHSAKMHLGMLKGVPVVCLEGRTHTYEGENCFDVIRTLIRTMKLIGCKTLLTTNAVGSLNKDAGPGDLLLIKDHINFMFSNPLIGPNDDRFGDRFVSMDNVYDAELRKKMLKVADELKIKIREGIYLATSGPSFETHAEIRAFKLLGADAVGMSTVPEVIVARHCGMRAISVAAITNLAAGLSEEVLSHEGTLKGAALAVEKLANLILGFVEDMGKK